MPSEIEEKAGEPGLAGVSSRAILACDGPFTDWLIEEMQRGSVPNDLLGGVVAVLLNQVIKAADIAGRHTHPSPQEGAQFLLNALGAELNAYFADGS